MQRIEREIKGAIFDLDGVLVDTAKYHYLAWKKLAKKLGFDFTEKDNERLKGISRTQSLEILLEIGGIKADDKQKEKWAEEKNQCYVEYLKQLDQNALLEGTTVYLKALREEGVKISLGSASKNAPLILSQLEIEKYFDAVIDGNCISKAKPDPEVFLQAAKALGLKPENCVVFEDSLAGIQAAKKGGMKAVGVGNEKNLPGADYYIQSLGQAKKEKLFI